MAAPALSTCLLLQLFVALFSLCRLAAGEGGDDDTTTAVPTTTTTTTTTTADLETTTAALECIGTVEKPYPSQVFRWLSNDCMQNGGPLLGSTCIEHCLSENPPDDFVYTCTKRGDADDCICFEGPTAECTQPELANVCVDPIFRSDITQEQLDAIDSTDCTDRSPPATKNCKVRCVSPGYEPNSADCECTGKKSGQYKTVCKVPSCIGVSCGKPPNNVQNAKVITKSEVRYKEYAMYACKDPYLPDASVPGIRMEGGNFLVACQRDGSFDLEAAKKVCQWDPDMVRNTACGAPPPIPLATILPIAGSTPQNVAHGDNVKYKCDEGTTEDGRKGGSDIINLECRHGYYRDYERKGCIQIDKAVEDTGWPGQECKWKDSLDKEGVDTSACKTRQMYEGESCVVKCQTDYYQAQPSGQDPPLEQQAMTPSLFVCSKGKFTGEVPRCERHRLAVQFDVYALLRKNPDTGKPMELCHPVSLNNRHELNHCEKIPLDESGKGSLPSNLDVYDLEGLLVNLYNKVFRFQQDFSVLGNMSKDQRTGKWRGDDRAWPRFEIYRDVVDTLVWYRITVQNPQLPIKYITHAQFGMFAAFQFGKATNEDAKKLFRTKGGVVGVKQNENDFITMYRSKGTNPHVNDAWCTKRAPRKNDAAWQKDCYIAEVPMFDREYMPSGAYRSFSLPGYCPAFDFQLKDEVNRKCPTPIPDEHPKGLCPPGKKPDGEHCTYSIQEIARISLDDVSGIKEQDCKGGRKCKNLKDFQLHCTNQKLRKGAKLVDEHNFVVNRECLEYSVDCDDDEIIKQDQWNCFEYCRDLEHGLDFWKHRCNATASAQRLAKLKELFEAAAQKQNLVPAVKREPIQILQDCEHLPACNKPDAAHGLSYCHRISTGLCTACYVADTSGFDERRVINLQPCRGDLFSSGGYQKRRRPRCNTKNGTFTCCAYFNECPRKWELEAEWTLCGSGDCGPGLQLKKAKCQYEDELGDCRRDLGDPRDSEDTTNPGYCNVSEDGTSRECFVVKPCFGQKCPWVKFCEGVADTNCIPTDYGPVDSECAFGYARRYKRCSQYPSMVEGVLGVSGSYCDEGELPKIPPMEECRPVPMKSRIDNCGNCPFETGNGHATHDCQDCVAPRFFQLENDDGSGPRCVNKEVSFVRLELELLLSAAGQEALKMAEFGEIEKVLAEAFEEAKVWTPDNFALLDIFHERRQIDDTPVPTPSPIIPGHVEATTTTTFTATVMSTTTTTADGGGAPPHDIDETTTTTPNESPPEEDETTTTTTVAEAQETTTTVATAEETTTTTVAQAQETTTTTAVPITAATVVVERRGRQLKETSELWRLPVALFEIPGQTFDIGDLLQDRAADLQSSLSGKLRLQIIGPTGLVKASISAKPPELLCPYLREARPGLQWSSCSSSDDPSQGFPTWLAVLLWLCLGVCLLALAGGAARYFWFRGKSPWSLIQQGEHAAEGGRENGKNGHGDVELSFSTPH